MDILDLVIQREAERVLCRQILEALEPNQLSVAALRMEGLSDRGIAVLFGVSNRTISGRMQRAKLRVARLVPEVAEDVMARSRSRGPWSKEGE